MRPTATPKASVLKYDQRFWNKVEIPSRDDCWKWNGLISTDGYGKHSVGKRTVRAHRYSYAWANGSVDPSLQVCHTCDNPKCVNPSHLFLGTSLDNQMDKVNKMRHCHGSKSPAAILSDDQVREIRRRYVPYKVSTVRLAKEYGVTQSAVWLIVANQNWKHLK